MAGFEDEEDLTVTEIYEALSSVQADVTLEAVSAWSSQQREQAVAWFVSKDMAEIGMDIEVVAMPAFLKIKA